MAEATLMNHTTEHQSFHPLDLDRLIRHRYAEDRLNCRWPATGVLLPWDWAGQDEDGYTQSLDFWRQYLGDSLQGEWAANLHHKGRLSTSDLDPRQVLIYGVSRLQERIVRAAHKRLFGAVPAEYSGIALELIGHALFQPPLMIRLKHFSIPERWAELIERAERLKAAEDKRQQQLSELLAGWSDEL
jgi:hypothetical protein